MRSDCRARVFGCPHGAEGVEVARCAPGEIGCHGAAGAVALPVGRQGSVARVRPVGCPGGAGGTVAGLGAFRWIGCGRRKCCRLPGRGHAALSLLARSDVLAVRWRCRLVRQGSVARVQPVGCPGVAGGTVAGLGAFRLIGCGRRKCCRLSADVLCGTVAMVIVLMCFADWR